MTGSSFVLFADPQIAAIRVEECGEPLVDLRAVDGLLLDRRMQDPEGVFARVREGLAARLMHAQECCPAGVRLLIVEGYRPPRVQRRGFEEYRQRLRRARPDWDAARARREASKYIAPPEVAPHCTGGAVDLTLCTDDGVELDMGTAVNANPLDSGNACYTAAANISAWSARNRRLLAHVLTAAGLVNYPTEWWHWSYGERYWAYTTGAAAALYGPATP